MRLTVKVYERQTSRNLLHYSPYVQYHRCGGSEVIHESLAILAKGWHISDNLSVVVNVVMQVNIA